MATPEDSRWLPPWNTSSTPPANRQWQPSFMNSGKPRGASGDSTIRSPTASCQPAYIAYPNANQANANYPHYMPRHDVQRHYLPRFVEVPGFMDEDFPELSRRRRSSPDSLTGFRVSLPRNYAPPLAYPMAPEEPTIQKKRKLAEPAQLKVLNETYSRTAFPSTEERIALAKKLDMSARSVQIWFQNKRASMRTSNSHSTNLTSSRVMEDLEAGRGCEEEPRCERAGIFSRRIPTPFEKLGVRTPGDPELGGMTTNSGFFANAQNTVISGGTFSIVHQTVESDPAIRKSIQHIVYFLILQTTILF